LDAIRHLSSCLLDCLIIAAQTRRRMAWSTCRRSKSISSTASSCARPGAEALRTMSELLGALLMGPDGGFITGSDFLMNGGVTAAYRFSELAR
jgi:hypothetical protein